MKQNLSAFPLPPKDYNQEYMMRLVRQLQIMINQMSQIVPGEFASDLTETVAGHPISALTLDNIPTSSANLPSGSVWSDAGTLKIVS